MQPAPQTIQHIALPPISPLLLATLFIPSRLRLSLLLYHLHKTFARIKQSIVGQTHTAPEVPLQTPLGPAVYKETVYFESLPLGDLHV